LPVDNTAFLIEHGGESKIKKNYPHTGTANILDLSNEQIDTFWSTVRILEKEQESLPNVLDRNTISGEYLRQRLVDTGKFEQNDAKLIIEGMHKFGNIEKVSYDTYRRKKERNQDNNEIENCTGRG
jgi:hypothetical protein